VPQKTSQGGENSGREKGTAKKKEVSMGGGAPECGEEREVGGPLHSIMFSWLGGGGMKIVLVQKNVREGGAGGGGWKNQSCGTQFEKGKLSEAYGNVLGDVDPWEKKGKKKVLKGDLDCRGGARGWGEKGTLGT